MYYTFKRVAVTGSIIGLFLLIAGIMYVNNRIAFTANLDTRPFNMGLVGKVNSLEPAALNNPEECLLASTMYEGLVYYDEKTRGIKPLVARSWKYSSDGKSLIITLDKGVRFHNGKKLTAADVKACWEKSFSTTKDWNSVSLFMAISGSNDRLNGKTAEISGVQAVNSSTLKITFDQPNAAFIYMLTNPIFWLYDAGGGVSPAPGTGPYILKENKENRKWTLVRNEKYHRGEPRLAGIEAIVFTDAYEAFGEYKAGRLDYLDSLPLKELKNLRNNEKYKKLLIEKPLFNTYALGFNINKAPFAGNYMLRRALNYALDRKVIIDEVLGGAYKPVKGAVPLGLEAYNKEMRGYVYDAIKAQELLEEAGYPMGEGLKPLTLTYNTGEGHRQVAESIAGQLALIGIEVQLQPLDWDYYKKQMTKSELSLFRLEWQADYPDADSFLYSLFHSSRVGMSNYCGYRNPQVDKILDAARAEIWSEQERIKLLKRAEEIIVDDAPCLWLFQTTTAKLIGEQVSSLQVNSMNMVEWYSVELLKPEIDGESKSAPGGKV